MHSYPVCKSIPFYHLITYFIYYIIPFFNTPNIPTSISFVTLFKYSFLFFFLLSLSQLAPAKLFKTPPLTSHLTHQTPASNHHHNHHATTPTRTINPKKKKKKTNTHKPPDIGHKNHQTSTTKTTPLPHPKKKKNTHTHTHITTTTTTKQNPQPITHHCTTMTHHAPPTKYLPRPTHHSPQPPCLRPP